MPIDSSIVKLDIFEVIPTYSERFDIRAPKRFISAQKMELNREHFLAIIFYNLLRRLTQQQCIDELNSMFGNEAGNGSTCLYEGCLPYFGIWQP